MCYLEGGVLFDPLGDDAGGHGAPGELLPGFVCDVPESLPELLPGVAGDEPEFDDPEDDPEFDEPGFDPEFGFDVLGAPGVPGNVPQGDPLGVVPGLF
jgi:hypothetical protein